MIPLTKFDTTFCSPQPTPTPIAPPMNAKADRLKPKASEMLNQELLATAHPSG
jgi:hypothetical protein